MTCISHIVFGPHNSISSFDSPCIVSFTWTGDRISTNHQLFVGTVHLLFENAIDKVKVNIPNEIASDTTYSLPFEGCPETKSDTLKLTIQQITSLKISVDLFKKTSDDETTNKKPEINEEIRVVLPDELEIGGRYSVDVSANQFRFTAKLRSID